MGARTSNAPLPAVPTSWDFAAWYQFAQGLIAWAQQFVFDFDPPGLIPSYSGEANNLTVILTWEPAKKASAYRIYRGMSGDFAQANLVAEVAASRTRVAQYKWQDSEDSTQASRYYWIVPVNTQAGKEGPKTGMITVQNFSIGTNATAGGVNASASGTNSTAFGYDSDVSGTDSTGVGSNCDITGARSTGIGRNVTIAHDDCVALCAGATPSGSNQLVIGSSTAKVVDCYIGEGPTTTTAANTLVRLRSSDGSGSNIEGMDLHLCGGQSTGNADGGAVIFQTAPPGSSGSSANSITERGRFLSRGHFRLTELTQNATSADVASLSEFCMYMKSDKLVFAFNNGGTMTFISIPMDGATTTWTQSTVAP